MGDGSIRRLFAQTRYREISQAARTDSYTQQMKRDHNLKEKTQMTPVTHMPVHDGSLLPPAYFGGPEDPTGGRAGGGGAGGGGKRPTTKGPKKGVKKGGAKQATKKPGSKRR